MSGGCGYKYWAVRDAGVAATWIEVDDDDFGSRDDDESPNDRR